MCDNVLQQFWTNNLEQRNSSKIGLSEESFVAASFNFLLLMSKYFILDG